MASATEKEKNSYLQMVTTGTKIFPSTVTIEKLQTHTKMDKATP